MDVHFNLDPFPISLRTYFMDDPKQCCLIVQSVEKTQKVKTQKLERQKAEE